jgi:FdhD protein
LHEETDLVATEEPLEVRIQTAQGEPPLLITMRTPGHDQELVRGWLHSEGFRPLGDLEMVVDPSTPNVVVLRSAAVEELLALSRAGVTSSACGICGAGSVERLALRAPPVQGKSGPLSARWLCSLPALLERAQPVYHGTGGVHAAGLVSRHGTLLAAFEDVGRHNALDKLIGWAWAGDQLPFGEHILVVTSRAGFEIVQKAVTAGAQTLVSVGAPTSLAVETAVHFGMALVGFLKPNSLKVYAGADRIEP